MFSESATCAFDSDDNCLVEEPVDQTHAKPLAVTRGGVHYGPAVYDPMLLVDADVGPASEDRNGDVERLPAVRPGLRLLALDRPAGVRVLLRRLGRRVRLDLARRPPFIDRRLLLLGGALARHHGNHNSRYENDL